MAVHNIEFTKDSDYWVTDPIICKGGDMRVRVHKKGPYPVNVLVSIDGEEEYIKHEDFGLESSKCEVTLGHNLPGQHMRFSSRSELLLVKYLES